ncbi:MULTISPECIES: hypothetical protein [Microbacterium]|uniref:Uncharacterized protein n=1 Tax=Microbacterium wangchenii TaxID=2541726 RepID=A0ABX5SSK5_9MICO|nr:MULTISPECIES: hypothetical protein [Microbacterium]MCK6068504.1 hypothetical protein [Microbacterium sp. EYE_512]QBR89148.1 hypothetical protein E4K62_10900 [Microbacterium wangchenii]TXK09220.1 hypothetical protein FVP99_18295 [Microbacterium wangchenii]
MTIEPSVWRTNDCEVFDLAREAVGYLVALLLDLTRSGALETDAAIDESRRLRHDLLEAGFDRARFNQLLARVEARTTELQGSRE